MQSTEEEINDRAAIAEWEAEGGTPAVIPVCKVGQSNKALLIGLGCLVALPFFYWLLKK